MDKLTNFYIRRSRRRFWKEENDQDKENAFQTLYAVLVNICKLLAPFSPFYAEAVYRSLTQEESVHFCDWPNGDQFEDNPHLREEILVVREIISLAHTIRAQKKIRVRQPLAKAQIALPPKFSKKIIDDNHDLIAEELNVKQIEILDDPEIIADKIAMPDARKLGPKFGKEVQNIIFDAKNGNFKELENGRIEVLGKILEADEFEIAFNSKSGFDVASNLGIVIALDTQISNELLEEGIAREIIRTLQDMRKEADYQISDRILVGISGNDQLINKFIEKISTEVLAKDILSSLDSPDLAKDVDIEGMRFTLKIKK